MNWSYHHFEISRKKRLVHVQDKGVWYYFDRVQTIITLIVLVDYYQFLVSVRTIQNFKKYERYKRRRPRKFITCVWSSLYRWSNNITINLNPENCVIINIYSISVDILIWQHWSFLFCHRFWLTIGVKL
jgi:hypothetical protein